MFWADCMKSSTCAQGGNHNNNGSGNYHIAYKQANSYVQSNVQAPVQTQSKQPDAGQLTWQEQWAWCCKCDSIHFGGAGGGKCTATGGIHDKSQSYNYHLPHSGNPGHKAQENWRWCNKCHCICFAGMGAGSCYAGGGHDFSQSYNYWFGQETHKGGAQDQFAWCKNCMCMFFKAYGISVCPANGGKHDGSQSYNYFIYHP
jgi:hypothetical protein